MRLELLNSAASAVDEKQQNDYKQNSSNNPNDGDVIHVISPSSGLDIDEKTPTY